MTRSRPIKRSVQGPRLTIIIAFFIILILVLGYSYGVKYPDPMSFLAVLVFTVFCVFLGLFFAWLRYKSNVAAVPALAHAAYNGSAGLLLITHWSKNMFDAGIVGWPAIVSLTVLLTLIRILVSIKKI